MTDIYEIWNRYDKSKTYMNKKNVLSKTERTGLCTLASSGKP